MGSPAHNALETIAALSGELAVLRPRCRGMTAQAVDRWRADAAALTFHLRDAGGLGHPIVAVLGGTGTGKSTLVNRLLGRDVSATSIRRTFTSGAVAFVSDDAALPPTWLDVEHQTTLADQPVRGQVDALLVVAVNTELTEKISLVDTPDLDGDTPSHHAQADRVFRWAQAVLFLVTPEKYQMTELLPYYRLAQRYAIPVLFAMNKAEEAAVVDDYARLLSERGWAGAEPFVIARDDAGFEPPAARNLQALRNAMMHQPRADAATAEQGLTMRRGDLAGRLTDQVIAPLKRERQDAVMLAATLAAMEAPEPGVDVSPLTRQLERRLQQRSVLYLMGPGRMIQRVLQVPGLLMRLPRTLWDAVGKGQANLNIPDIPQDAVPGKLPDFRATAAEQLAQLQTRIDDALRSSPAGERWLADNADSYAAAKLDPREAGRIVDEELAALKDWIEKHWNANPRDTDVLMKFLHLLPGGARLAKWTEARAELAPYLLAVIVIAAHHPVVLAGFSLSAWLSERLSNEVVARTRAANQKISERFTSLAHRQIEAVCRWLLERSVPTEAMEKIEALSEKL